MSHLTTSVLNRPSAYHHNSSFEFPRPVHPLSPPETEDDMPFGGGNQARPHAAPLQMQMPQPPSGLGLEFDSPSHAPIAPHETPATRFRKISYVQASGHREGRERQAAPKSRWLVVVMPPPAFSKQHGQLGHTLSQGPSSRLFNGVLLPLFPTVSDLDATQLVHAKYLGLFLDVRPARSNCTRVQLPIDDWSLLVHACHRQRHDVHTPGVR
jgi:hypothetical protein